jgi:hypothetical protein
LRGRGTAEGGGGGDRLRDARQDIFQALIIQNICRRNAKHSNSFSRQPTITAFIMLRLLLVIMQGPIYLNRQSGRRTIKIQNVWPNRMLAPKP